MEQLLSILLYLAVLAPPVILAITVHEAAHGWVAHRRGDPTAWLLGRVTFNPLKHIDPVGTVAVPVLIFITTKSLGIPLLFGWAKPVPVDWRRLRNPRWDMALVALAGPAANLLMALGWGLLLQVLILLSAVVALPGAVASIVVEVCVVGVAINLFLMALNLVPLLPLDGGRILNALLPRPAAAVMARAEPYGLFILLALLLLPSGQPPGLLGEFLRPLVSAALLVTPAGDVVRQYLPI